MNLSYCIPLEAIKILFEKSIINNFKNTRTLCCSFRHPMYIYIYMYNIYPMYN